MRIVHIMMYEKFARDYILFLDTHFDIQEHVFYVTGKSDSGYPLDGLPNIVKINSHRSLPGLIKGLLFADKIILHGLWHPVIIRLLLLMPWTIHKCYWMLWGGDFYFPDKEPAYKKKLIKRIRHFVGFIRGDFDFICTNYGAKGVFHECILYPVVFADSTQTVAETNSNKEDIKILVGNSADPSNNHFEIFQKLTAFPGTNFELFVPLSYGNDGHALSVIEAGIKQFGNKLKPLQQFMSFESYKQLLKSVDIAIFNHKRQQGLGNIVQLLANGKKVFLRKDVTTWRLFTDMGVKIYDIEKLNLEPIDSTIAKENIRLVRQYFNELNYICQLEQLFEVKSKTKEKG